MRKKITYRISPDGSQVEIKPEGFTGNECIAETKDVEEALGVVVDRKKTREAGLTNTESRRIKE